MDFMDRMVAPNLWRDWMRKGVCEVLEGYSELVPRCGERKWTAVRVEYHGVGDSSAACTRDVALVVPVMVEGWPNVEPMGTVWGPSAAFIGSVMDDYFAP